MKLTSPIIAFMLASAGIHIGLVIVSNNTTSVVLPSSVGSTLSVKKKENQQTLKKDNIVKKQDVAKSVQKKPTQKPRPQEISRQIKKTTLPSEKLTKAEKTVKTKSPATNKQNAESKARVISIIYTELSQHFTYPKLAQRRNWQGKVLLSLQVTSTGKIKNVQLSSSSGYGVLDQAAINSLINMGHLPQVSSWLSYDIDLKIPVIYQLTEG